MAKRGKRKPRRVVAISDLHCGHLAGLTPPSWQMAYNENAESDILNSQNRWAELQRTLWEEYVAMMKALQPIDVLFVLGDCIDGRGEASGGTELITANRKNQADMAVECVKKAQAGKIVMVYGTPYHTGKLEDWEDGIAKAVNAKSIGSHEWADVNGLIFDLKHKVGNSQIPHGKGTAISREKVWNILWADAMMQPRADVVVRGHVHFCHSAQEPDGQALTMPALQGMGTRFGARQCSGIVHWGCCYWDVVSGEEWSWHPMVRKLKLQQTKAIKL